MRRVWDELRMEEKLVWLLFFLKGDTLDATKNVPAEQTQADSVKLNTLLRMVRWLGTRRLYRDNAPRGGRRNEGKQGGGRTGRQTELSGWSVCLGDASSRWMIVWNWSLGRRDEYTCLEKFASQVSRAKQTSIYSFVLNNQDDVNLQLQEAPQKSDIDFSLSAAEINSRTIILGLTPDSSVVAVLLRFLVRFWKFWPASHLHEWWSLASSWISFFKL